jgi:hypothetical protein
MDSNYHFNSEDLVALSMNSLVDLGISPLANDSKNLINLDELTLTEHHLIFGCLSESRADGNEIGNALIRLLLLLLVNVIHN